MSPSLDQIATAVVERIMAQAKHRYPPQRRPPRAYIKSLTDTRRSIPSLVLPTGSVPDEPWYDPHEDEAEIPLIGEAFLEYEKEHSHRTRMTRYQVERAVSSFLDASKLHDNEPIWTVTRELCKGWRAALTAGTPVRNGKRQPGHGTIQARMRMVSHFLEWCALRQWLPSGLMKGLSLPKRLVAASKVKKGPFTEEELAEIIPALLA